MWLGKERDSHFGNESWATALLSITSVISLLMWLLAVLHCQLQAVSRSQNPVLREGRLRL